MLGFKRFCVVAWTGSNGFACNALMQVTCNSGFLPMGDEMHYILFICVITFSPNFAMFALSQTPLILALVVLVEIDHSDHEMISVIRVIVRRLPCAYAVVYTKNNLVLYIVLDL